MKMCNYVLLYLGIIIVLLLPLQHHSWVLEAAERKQLEYNRALDNAVMDGIFHLVEKDSTKEVILNKEKAVNYFFESLYCNFGIITNQLEKRRLHHYIPIIVVTDKDGFYLNYSKIEQQKDGTRILTRQWTKKQPYFLSKDNFIYEFTLGNELKLYDSKRKLILEGDYHDFAGKYSGNQILNHPVVFEETRRNCIITHLKEAMRKGILQHNNTVKNIGVNYQFYFPSIRKEDWYRTIDDISFLAVIQGYPWKEGTGNLAQGSYHHYAIGSARAWKASSYYVSSENQEGQFFYHRENCNRRAKEELVYWDKKECAKIGAFPCRYCMP